jgi:hypothetical protein
MALQLTGPGWTPLALRDGRRDHRHLAACGQRARRLGRGRGPAAERQVSQSVPDQCAISSPSELGNHRTASRCCWGAILLGVRPSTNSSLRLVFPQEDELFELILGRCSCDLVIAGAEPSVEDRLARLRGGYEKRGWSQPKIARAVADWQVAHERQLEKRAAPTEQLVALLRRLASTHGGVRMFVHFYSGQFDREKMRTRGQVTIAADQLVMASLIPEDTLTEIMSASAG